MIALYCPFWTRTSYMRTCWNLKCNTGPYWSWRILQPECSRRGIGGEGVVMLLSEVGAWRVESLA